MLLIERQEVVGVIPTTLPRRIALKVMNTSRRTVNGFVGLAVEK